MTDKIVVFVTCGSASEARRVGRALVERRAAACVNIFASSVQSIYRWKGKIETSNEYLVMIKTSRKQFAGLQRTVQSLHSYDVPEIIAVPITKGSRDYLAWVSASVRPLAKSKKLGRKRFRSKRRDA
jgi:periplasmic divalent cation tolerance protein